MLQDIDATVAPTVMIERCGNEDAKFSTADPSAGQVNFISPREELLVGSKASYINAERLPDIANLTIHRVPQVRLFDPVEDSLHWLVSAVALGYLLLTFVGI